MLTEIHLDRQLHRMHVINYTFLATVHLFMAGIAFLYAVWHSATVRSRLALVDVEYTVHAAISVLADLMEKCPPAEACKDALERMSKVTIKMGLSTTGFGSPLNEQMARSTQQDYKSSPSPQPIKHELSQDAPFQPRRPPPRFDMDLQDLFPETRDGRSFEGSFGNWQASGGQAALTQPMPQYLQPSAYPSAQTQYDVHLPPLAPPTSTTEFPDDPYALPIDWDVLLSSDPTAMYGGNPGLDLGFTGDHNWADGTPVDLFDGFFFGGTAGAG